MPNRALRRWRLFAILWPVACVIFLGIILMLPGRNLDERIADTGFIMVSLIFFAIGMAIRRRMWKEQSSATVLTTAAVVSRGMRVRPGKRTFFPEYQFQAGGKTYHVKSHIGYGACFVGEGSQVELYYDPENPRLFYVPVMQRHDRRVSALLCGIGVVFPLISLSAPLLRVLFG